MKLLLDLVSWAALLAGGAFVFLGGLGVLRLPDLYTRMHAASLTDTLGTLLIILGLMLQAGWSLSLAKLFGIVVFLFVLGPTATYALANAAWMAGRRPRGADTLAERSE